MDVSPARETGIAACVQPWLPRGLLSGEPDPEQGTRPPPRSGPGPSLYPGTQDGNLFPGAGTQPVQHRADVLRGMFDHPDDTSTATWRWPRSRRASGSRDAPCPSSDPNNLPQSLTRFRRSATAVPPYRQTQRRDWIRQQSTRGVVAVATKASPGWFRSISGISGAYCLASS